MPVYTQLRDRYWGNTRLEAPLGQHGLPTGLRVIMAFLCPKDPEAPLKRFLFKVDVI